MSLTYFHVPITKADKATRIISGPISGPGTKDLDGQIVDLDWLRDAVKPWMKFGNIRLQHDVKRPIGRATEANLDTADGVPIVTARILDDEAWKMIEGEVYSGFSVGIKNPVVVKQPGLPKGRIVGGDLVELSVVDHPAHPDAKFTIAKLHGGVLTEIQQFVDAYLDYIQPEPVGFVFRGVNTGDILAKHALTEDTRDDLKDAEFAVPGKRRLPIHDLNHAQLAWDMVDRTHGLSDEERAEARKRIKRALARFEGTPMDKSAAIETPPQFAEHSHGDVVHTHHFMHADHDHCPNCGSDMAMCSCPSEGKSASFTSAQETSLIRPSHTATPVSAPRPVAEGEQPNPTAQQDAIFRQVLSRMDQMMGRLERIENANFNPNNTRDGIHEGAQFREGLMPSSEDTTWHGQHPQHVEDHKAADPEEDEAEHLLAKSVATYFDTLLSGDLTKAASVGTTKAAIVDAMKQVAADAAKEALMAVEDRLAQVEATPLPPKGNTGASPHPQPVEKSFSGNPTTPAPASEDEMLMKMLIERQRTMARQQLTDDEQHKLTQMFLRGMYSQGPNL